MPATPLLVNEAVQEPEPQKPESPSEKQELIAILLSYEKKHANHMQISPLATPTVTTVTPLIPSTTWRVLRQLTIVREAISFPTQRALMSMSMPPFTPRPVALFVLCQASLDVKHVKSKKNMAQL